MDSTGRGGGERKVPGHFDRNASERGRLQGLMRFAAQAGAGTKLRLSGSDGDDDDDDVEGGREGVGSAKWAKKNLRRLRVWMVNDGELLWVDVARKESHVVRFSCQRHTPIKWSC